MRNKISNPLRLASNQGARSGRKEQAWSTLSAALTLGLLALTPVIDECFTWIRSESILEKFVYPVLLTHDCSEVYILRYARREKDVTSAQNRTRSQTVVVADMTILEPISASMSWHQEPAMGAGGRPSYASKSSHRALQDALVFPWYRPDVCARKRR
jgi:hypothetical protein